MGVFTDLANRVKEYIKHSIKLRSLSKEDISTIVDNLIATHKNIILPIEGSSKKEVMDILSKYRNITSNSPDQYKHVLSDLTKLNGRKASAMVMQDHEFMPIFKANKKFITILSQIKADLDKIIVDKELTLFTTRLSHTALLGLLRQSDLYSKYSAYLLSMIIRTCSDASYMVPGYRAKYLLDNKVSFSEVTNLISEKIGTYRFLNEIEDMRKSNSNSLLYANGQTFDIVTKASGLSMSTMSAVRFGISALDIFSWVIGMVDDYNHTQYLKNKVVKEWMEAHVAILKMELSGVNRDDPKYVQFQKIISAYDAEINAYDKKINKYLKE